MDLFQLFDTPLFLTGFFSIFGSILMNEKMASGGKEKGPYFNFKLQCCCSQSADNNFLYFNMKSDSSLIEKTQKTSSTCTISGKNHSFSMKRSLIRLRTPTKRPLAIFCTAVDWYYSEQIWRQKVRWKDHRPMWYKKDLG